eukprot:CAMPEP_0198650532 /NCGR_PEP_ID=MMETSP1467-20131203/5048_1 /TAXON_ID=1462469 /ORGANISM="unid. sp., Strain CCMP2135" /LENGTH=68 /DNA_ID=CAMNT_0044386389 /DNA_START=26 /DNA_END=229 /DNA_ORIENTATION=-
MAALFDDSCTYHGLPAFTQSQSPDDRDASFAPRVHRVDGGRGATTTALASLLRPHKRQRAVPFSYVSF